MVCVTVRGDVDLSTTPRLRRAFLDLDSAGHTRLEVDLQRVEFLDSAGIGVLIGALRRARRAGGDLVVGAAGPEVGQLFALLGLDRVFGYPAQAAASSGTSSGGPAPS